MNTERYFFQQVPIPKSNKPKGQSSTGSARGYLLIITILLIIPH